MLAPNTTVEGTRRDKAASRPSLLRWAYHHFRRKCRIGHIGTLALSLIHCSAHIYVAVSPFLSQFCMARCRRVASHYLALRAAHLSKQVFYRPSSA